MRVTPESNIACDALRRQRFREPTLPYVDILRANDVEMGHEGHRHEGELTNSSMMGRGADENEGHDDDNRLIELQMEGSNVCYYQLCRHHEQGPLARGDAERAHPSRADRPTSFNLDDIAVPHGCEEGLAIHPDASHPGAFRPANYDAGDAPVTVDAPASSSRP